MRVRFYMRVGNDLWIAYVHVLNTDTAAGIPRTRETSLTIKYTYTFSR